MLYDYRIVFFYRRRIGPRFDYCSLDGFFCPYVVLIEISKDTNKIECKSQRLAILLSTSQHNTSQSANLLVFMSAAHICTSKPYQETTPLCSTVLRNPNTGFPSHHSRHILSPQPSSSIPSHNHTRTIHLPPRRHHSIPLTLPNHLLIRPKAPRITPRNAPRFVCSDPLPFVLFAPLVFRSEQLPAGEGFGWCLGLLL